MSPRETQPAATVQLGMFVALELIDASGQTEPLAAHIVAPASADLEAGLLGVDTPLAQAILGRSAGDQVPYRRGDIQAVRIVGVARSRADAAAAAERRQEVLRKALEAAERTNAEMFASSFTGKWGDYDPDGVAKWEEDGDAARR
ncbi:MAG: GreA/GreB family elongation factor [Anaerolineae bacterium]|nr:GreA/GreB family elongation factor [Anaerolineae bacterium]